MNKIVDITAENFKLEVLDNPGVVLLDFWASWCGPCKMLAPILGELAEETTVKICKVDVDSNNELAGEFKIRSIPTIIIFKNGEKVDEMVGFKAKEELKEKLSTY
ncbi:MAG: thioredoxin [Fusobacteriaceae bacterium]